VNRPAIVISNLTKSFRLYPDPIKSRIFQAIFFWKIFYKKKIALSKINLTIKRGEIVGILGPNGAGKTTLLKIIANISRPTSGEVITNGRIVCVLALGLGFHPRLTGLENIRLAGMMLGISKKDIESKIDWIINFAEIGDYINYPLTSYSTGMRARLSFAIAACQNPEILIIDEALATGDMYFVQKCISRIQEITASGTTALFVSHNIWSIKRLTNRCILVENGQITADGETTRVADAYYEAILKNEVTRGVSSIADLNSFVGTGEAVVINIATINCENISSQNLTSGKFAKITLEIFASKYLQSVGISIQIMRSDGVFITAISALSGGTLNSEFDFIEPSFTLGKGASKFEFCFKPLLLAPGDYSIDIHLMNMDEYDGYTSNQQYYFKPRILEFNVTRIGNPNRSIAYYQPYSLKKFGPL
jgi:ABC-type polysaccharide/polyol phosphate transport system ATPase subunit